MVRSMMNLTTLPLSFWGYALEAAARILNMVPTKKVDKTPYELWFGKVPNLSYLKDTQRKRWVTISTSHQKTKYLLREVEGFEPPHKEEAPVCRSERLHRAPNRLCLNVEVEEHKMQSMKDNQVWCLVDLPPNGKTAGSKWLFKKKTDMDGNVHTYKAHLVANVFTQTYGVDCEETFLPVVDIRAIRILIAIAAFYDYEIWQMDAVMDMIRAYRNVLVISRLVMFGKKSTDMVLLIQFLLNAANSFVNTASLSQVYQYCWFAITTAKMRSKQPRAINDLGSSNKLNTGFTQNLDEPCVYQKASGSNVTFLILYADDIIIMRNHIPSLQSVKEYLGKCFAMKDLGKAAFILGIKIYRDRSRRLIGLSQSAYMDKILKRYKMDNFKRGYIPMQERLDLNKTQGDSTPREVKCMQNVPYASANPGELHWTAVKTILKYLRNTKDMFLVYGGNPKAELRVDCYLDWKSSKQSTTAMSAIEAEYIADLEAGMEAVWIRKFISGLGIGPTINKPIRILCDNSAALHFANKPGVQRGARHFHRKYHYVRECIKLDEIKFLKFHTYENIADPFTKALLNKRLTQHARSMGLRLASSFM
uniref:Reverse transcriptase Ty1/copia-type domain-containing protein n=1 Tax=Tanacetum cinerariifolium TaxID=118510 RepID=A0A699I5J1_TANCI|nr:hypothetical protein [Tanacetum cinerariifolium]